MEKLKSMFKPSKPKPVEQKQPSPAQMLEQAMFTLLAWRDFPPEQLANQLNSLTDQLLWADKNSPQTISKIVEAELFDQTLSSIFTEHRVAVLQMSTLLLSNLKTQQTVDYLMGCELSRCILLTDSSNDDEVESYYVGWLRAYSQRITKDNARTLVYGDHCNLLERCASYSNSEDSMMRTTSLNVILNLIKMDLDELRPCLVSEGFTVFYVNLCDLFNETLLEIDKELLSLNEVKLPAFAKMLEDLDDLLLFFDDLSTVKDPNIVRMVGTVVYEYLLLPSLLSSMRLKHNGKISVNLAIFVLVRMMRLLENLGVINIVVRLMFCPGASAEQWVEPPTMSNSNRSANIRKLLQGQVLGLQCIRIDEIRESLFSFFKSKDDNLIYLMTTLFLVIIKSKSLDKKVREECGLCLRSDDPITRRTRSDLNSVLCQHMEASSHFRVITMKNIAALLVETSMVKNDCELTQQARNSLCTAYQQYIVAGRESLKDSSQYDRIAEYFENDAKYISQRLLDTPTLGREAFSVPDVSDQRLSFYERIPGNQYELQRHNLLMFVLLRKLRYMLIRESKLPPDEQNLEKLYNSRLTSQAGNYRPGEFYDIKGRKFYPCSIVGDKVEIPWYYCDSFSYIVEDDLHFILAVPENSKLKIVVNLKFKFVNPVVDHRNISRITLGIRGYDTVRHEYISKENLELYCSNEFVSRNVATQLLAKRSLNRQAQLSFISKLLTNSQKDLPCIDLL